MIRQYFYRIKIVFQIMSSLLKSSYYNQEFLIINFIILFWKYYLARLKYYRMLIVILVLLIENARNSKVKNINFNSISFQKIIISKKRNRHKIIFELMKRLLDFIRSFKQTLFFSFSLFLNRLVSDAVLLK